MAERERLVVGGHSRFFHLFHEGGQHLSLGHHADLLALAEYNCTTRPGSDPNVGVLLNPEEEEGDTRRDRVIVHLSLLLGAAVVD